MEEAPISIYVLSVLRFYKVENDVYWMDSGHRASGQGPWVESPGSGSLKLNGSSRFSNRAISTASLNSIDTRLPRYSLLGAEQSIFDQEVHTSTLRDEEVYAHGETTSSQRTADGDTTTSAEGPSFPDNSNVRDSVASTLPPRYSSSFIPPRYSGVFGIPVQLVTAEGVSRTEHTYNICSGLKNKPWAAFRVFSQPSPGASQKHQKFPRFSGGDMIEGLIEFTLHSPQTVNSITVSLRGRVIRGSFTGESDTFLDHQVSIWTRASGDPRFPNPGSTKKFDGKLKGGYQFPFAFPFPTHVNISTSAAFSLPLQTPSNPIGTSCSSSLLNATVSSSTSSPLPPATSPRTSRFRSFSNAANSSSSSGSKNAASTHMTTNHQYTSTGTHISRLPTERISPSTGTQDGRRKKSLNERHRNEVNPFPIPKAPEESEKARLKRVAEELDRAQTQLEGNSSTSLPVHVYPTPQTFLERGIHANVQYELVLHIAHGVLRTASKLKTAIVYTPSIVPPPASVARQLAYTEGAPLPGPATDLDGWQTLPRVTVSGELLGGSKVEVECTLSLAKPLCYTRGTVIPCYLTLESSNSHALGLLSSPKSPFVRLARRVRYSRDPSSTVDDVSTEGPTSFIEHTLRYSVVPSVARFSGSSRLGGTDINMDNNCKLEDVVQKDDEVALAVWWIPPKDAPQEMYLKRLEGEIHLPKDLQPTCTFLPFSVEYAVEMLPLASHAFEPARSRREQCLLSQPVEIATHHSEEGPMPTTFTEPMSDREREKRKKEREQAKEQVTEIVGFL